MIVSYPPFYPQQILDADGKPVAGGRILSFYAGTDVPLAMFAPDGTSLGSSVSIASDGTAVFCLKVGTPYKLVCVDADGATIWTRDKVKCSAGDGMVNPMDAKNQMIVGGVDGDPTTIAPTARNQVVTFDGDDVVFAAPKVPAAAGDTRYKDNVYDAIDPTAPLKKGVRVGSGGRAWMTLEIEPSTTTDDVLCTEEVDGEKVIGWGQRMKNPMTDQGDLIAGAVGGAPMRLAHPGGIGFLRATISFGMKVLQWVGLNQGTGITITQDGSGATISADAQPGDHQLLVSATDAAAGYLGAKLTAGSNITLTTNTDGDGVQTLEISAAGGGGGGGSKSLSWSIHPGSRHGGQSLASGRVFSVPILFCADCTPEYLYVCLASQSLPASLTVKAAIGEYTWRGSNWYDTTPICYYGEVTTAPTSLVANGYGYGVDTQCPVYIKIPLTHKTGFTKINAGEVKMVAFSFSAAAYTVISTTANYAMQCWYNTQFTLSANGTLSNGGTAQLYVPCVGVLG